MSRASPRVSCPSLWLWGGSAMVAAGVSLRVVQEIGGWTSLRMLERYAHPSDTEKRRSSCNVGGFSYPVVIPIRRRAQKRGHSGRSGDPSLRDSEEARKRIVVNGELEVASPTGFEPVF